MFKFLSIVMVLIGTYSSVVASDLSRLDLAIVRSALTGAGVELRFQTEDLCKSIAFAGPDYLDRKLKEDVKMLDALGLMQYCTNEKDLKELLFLARSSASGAGLVANQRWLRLVGVWDNLHSLSEMIGDLQWMISRQDSSVIAACNFYEKIRRDGGCAQDRLLISYINSSQHNFKSVFVEFVHWLSVCQAHYKCRENDPRELDILWEFFRSTSCWTASMQVMKKDLWNQLHSAEDVVRAIKPLIPRM